MKKTKEVFKLIEESKNYYVSNLGRVKHVLRSGVEKILKPQKHLSGYQIIGVKYNGTDRIITKTIHRLVSKAFMPDFREDLDINHKDGDKTNNRLSNLEQCTAKENTRHAMEVLHKHIGNNKGCYRSPEAIEKHKMSMAVRRLNKEK